MQNIHSKFEHYNPVQMQYSHEIKILQQWYQQIKLHMMVVHYVINPDQDCHSVQSNLLIKLITVR